MEWMDEGMNVTPHDLAEYFAHIYLEGLYKTKQFYGLSSK
jgi:hypothetical protein